MTHFHDTMTMKARLLLVFAFLMSAALTWAAEYTVRHIGLKDGLSNGYVQDLAVDNQGFVWVATESGLNRLAGENVTVFRKNDSGLRNNVLYRLYFDSSTDKLWIALRENGIDIFDCTTKQFSSLDSSNGLVSDMVRDIKPASDGGIWILHINGNIQHYDPVLNIFSNHVGKIKFISRVILDAGNNKLYIGHPTDGMSVYDIKTGKTLNFRHNPSDPSSLPGNNVRDIRMDRLKNIWVGTNAGLAIFNPSTHEFTKCNSGLAGNNIFGLMEHDGLWVASDLGGISVINPDEAASTGINDGYVVKTVTPENSELSSPNVRKTITDQYGNIWVGNYSTGVDVLTQSDPFSTVASFSLINGRVRPDKFYGITTDKNSDIWLGGENELALLRHNKLILRKKIIPHGNRREALVYSLLSDHDGNIWLGMNDAGVIVYDSSSDRFFPIELGEDMLDVNTFLQDADGKIWIGSENGLFSFHNGNVRKEDEINSQLSSWTIYSLLRSHDGNLWIGTGGDGVVIFDSNGKKIKHINNLPSQNVNHIIQDSDNEFWIATYEGVVNLSPQDSTLYDESNGLADNNTRAIAQDRSGDIWVSTYSGISRINKASGRIYNYNYEDGVPLGGFLEGGVATHSDGTLYFSSPNGVCYFNPQLQVDDYTVSPIEIIDCVKINDNSYRITFTVRDYAQTGQVEYAYILEGTHGKWHTTDKESHVSVRDIPPGKYTFKVKARWKNGEWDDDNVASVAIEVNPPLWAAWWAKCIYAFIAACIIWVIVIFYKRHLQQKNSLEMQRHTIEMEKKQRQDEQDLNNERMRFYTNIAHEIRTPLTLIIGPLEDLMNDTGIPSGSSRKVNMIHQSALRLLNLINQIMEFRKTETHNRQLLVEKGNIANLVKEISLRFKELNRNEKVDIVLDIKDIGLVYYDSDIISTVLNNLLSNAVKYTLHGTICISLHKEDSGPESQVVISVADTGYGIEESAIPHIFERYYQVQGKHQASGSGIGLALVKSLADVHQGSISVSSTLGKGTTFTLRISAADIYPAAMHKETEISVVEETKMDDENADIRPIVLVVEDNDDIRAYIADTLSERYRILQARNGKEGYDEAIFRIPDLIVSDVLMPEMDGIEMCRRLKSDVRTSHIPIVLLTAKDSLRDKETGYECGADSYLTKPFTAKLLLARIDNLLENRRRLKSLILSRAEIPDPDQYPSEEVCLPAPKLGRLDEEFLKKLTALIEENLDKENIDMNFVTERMNMSYSTFYRKMKALTGLKGNEYIRKIKLRNSVRLLLSGDYNISEAAMMTGFNNLGNFRMAFKEEYGMSPSDYIKRHKE